MDGNRHGGVALAHGQTIIQVAIVSLSMSVLLFIILVVIPSDRTVSSVLVVLLGLPLITALALKSRMESPDYFEIIYPISFIYFLSFCLRGIVLIANPADMNWGVDGFKAINKALGFGLLGLISMWLGYYYLSSKPGKHINALVNRLLPDEWRTNKAIKRILFLFVVGISLQIIAILAGLAQAPRVGVASALVTSFSEHLTFLSTIGLFLFSLFVFRRKDSERKLLQLIIWGCMLLSEVLIGMIAGSRSVVLISLFIIPMICYNYTRKHVSIKLLLMYIVLLLVVFLAVIMPLVGPFKRAISTSSSSRSLSEYLRAARQGSYEKALGEKLSELSRRQILLENLAIVITETPSTFPFQNGRTFLSAATNLIPRIIWSEKVTYNLDSWFSREYVGWREEWLVKGSANPLEGNIELGIAKGSTGVTNMGELYINFGLTGLVIGMFILGLLYRSVYKNLIGNQAVGDLKILVYYSFLMSFIWVEGSLGSLFVGIIIRILILVAVVIFLRINIGTRERPMHSYD